MRTIRFYKPSTLHTRQQNPDVRHSFPRTNQYQNNTMKACQFLNLATIILLVTVSGYGQPTDNRRVDLPRTQEFVLYSNMVKQEYKLYVSTPPGYQKDKAYSVVYLLDADYSFPIVKGITDHLSQRGDLEDLILVGIAYHGPDRYQWHRTRDYTPVPTTEGGYSEEIQRTSGGGPNFIKFMEHELIPFINNAFRVTETRCIVGHSYGGLLVSSILFSDSRLFRKYIIVSPSVWYANKYLLQAEQDYAKKQNKGNADVYLAIGSLDSKRMLTDTDSLVNQMQQHRYSHLTFRSQILLNETHNSIFPSAVSNGLRFVFNGK